jgi:putative sigma-54 modulation protein
MQVQITGHHVEITPGLRSFVTAKLGKLEEHFPKIRKVTVVLAVEKYRHTAEIHFHADGVELSAKKTTKDMYASVEEALAAIVQQAVKRKDRLRSQNSRRKGGEVRRRLRSNAPVEEEEPRVSQPRVIRTRPALRKPLSLEDALALFEGSGQPFLLFKDAATGETQLLYRREDGHYGLMEA